MPASEIEPVASGLFIWRFYDPGVRAELFSTGLETPAGTFLIDPIPLDEEALADLASGPEIAGIVVTSENHERAAGMFAAKFSVPIYCHAATQGMLQLPARVIVEDGAAFSPGLTAVAIDGGPGGELSVHFDGGAGTFVMGDALINFEPHGFGLLPAKYCSDFKLMRRSLSKLLKYSFDRMLFAHGTPILSGARARLEQLLEENG
jgi:hypothetical protein